MIDAEHNLNPDIEKYYLHRTLNGVPIYRPIERFQEQLPKSAPRTLRGRVKTGMLYALPFIGLSAVLTYAESLPNPRNYLSIVDHCQKDSANPSNYRHIVEVKNAGYTSGDGLNVRVDGAALYYAEDNPVPDSVGFAVDNKKAGEKIEVAITVGQALHLFGDWHEGGVIKKSTFSAECAIDS